MSVHPWGEKSKETKHQILSSAIVPVTVEKTELLKKIGMEKKTWDLITPTVRSGKL